MFRNVNSAVVFSIGLLCPVLFYSGLFFPATLQAETSPGISRFTLQRERTPEDDLTSQRTSALPDIEITEKSGTYTIKIVAVIDAPAQSVRYVLTDYSHLYRLNPAISESEVLKQEEDGSVSVRTKINGCASYFCEELNRVETVKQLPSGEIYAEIIPRHGQFKSGQTHWNIKSLGERSEVSYLASMEPDIYIPPVVSKFLVKKAIKQEAVISFANLEKLSSNLCSGQGAEAEKSSICN
ncbi:MAG: hypothetical protein LJE83_06005 [Gammaproteobacteria bacterium]|nr:hypothetical protein [Gammaproteobacteria bacterium]